MWGDAGTCEEATADGRTGDSTPFRSRPPGGRRRRSDCAWQCVGTGAAVAQQGDVSQWRHRPGKA
jgi:hypothetical protein